MARKKVNTGLQQAREIYDIYNNQMDLKQKEAFMLGRLAIMLEVGNRLSDSFNETIKMDDECLIDIRKKLYSMEDDLK